MMINASYSRTLINTAQARMNHAAADMAGSRPETTDIAGAMVGMMTATREIKIAVSTIRTQDQMLGSLLDIKA